MSYISLTFDMHLLYCFICCPVLKSLPGGDGNGNGSGGDGGNGERNDASVKSTMKDNSKSSCGGSVIG